MLETLLGSRLRSKVLGWLFSHPDERYFVRQLAGLIREDSTNVSRELARLASTGFLISAVEGRQKLYQANWRSPVYYELRRLIVRAAAVPDARTLDVVAERFKVRKDRLAEFCRRHHIRKLALFGSVLRDDFRSDSDVDVLVEFELGHVPGFAIIDMESELSKLAGRKVDIRTPGDLSRYFRDRVVKEARVEYAATEP